MKKIIVISIAILTQNNSFAMHTLAAIRLVGIPRNMSVAKSCPQRQLSWSNKSMNRYNELMLKWRISGASIAIMRRIEKETLKSVAENAGKLKIAFDNRESQKLHGICLHANLTDCNDSIAECTCHNKIQEALISLQESISSLEGCRDSLRKLQLDDCQNWNLRQELLEAEYKKSKQK